LGGGGKRPGPLPRILRQTEFLPAVDVDVSVQLRRTLTLRKIWPLEPTSNNLPLGTIPAQLISPRLLRGVDPNVAERLLLTIRQTNSDGVPIYKRIWLDIR